MRILEIGKYYPPYRGGMEAHLELVARGLARAGDDVDVVVAHTKPFTSREVHDGVRVTRVGSVATFASTALCPTMPLELARRRYDLCHMHFPNPMGTVAYLASPRPAQHALVVTYQSDIIRQERLHKLYAPIERRLLARADVLLCTSPNYVSSSTTLEPFREKCRIIPLGIELGEFEATPALLEHAAAIRARYSRPIVLAVGRFVYYKGFEVAVRAMSGLEADLVLVGEGPLEPTLRALAREHGVADRVHFAGNVPSVAPYYHAAHVLAFPSIARSEAYGLVQVEAMASGLPVVNTSLDSGVPFVCRHEREGLTVPPGDTQALQAALRRLLEDDELRRRLGAAAHARAHSEFAASIMVERIRNLFAEMSARVMGR